LPATGDPEAQLCILHSPKPHKDPQAFAEALDAHRQDKGDNFELMVFPVLADFRGVTFSRESNFDRATFAKRADFTDATFARQPDCGSVRLTRPDFSHVRRAGQLPQSQVF
jgi:hypothetical protein